MNFKMMPLLTYAVYIVLLVLLVWGGKIATKKKTTDGFHDDFMSLEVTKSLRGLAAIGVILHHISQEALFQQCKELSFFVNAGYFFVAIFFFCSGYGLIKNLDTKPGYMNGFLKKRLPVILVPYYVSALLYFIFRFFICKEKMPPAQIVTGLLGLTMMNEYAWYPVILFLLYLVFFILFRKDTGKGRAPKLFMMFIFIIFLGMVFCVNGHFAWWAKKGLWWKMGAFDNAKWWMHEKMLLFSGEWWVNSPIAFLIGMIFANSEQAIVKFMKKLYPLKLIVVIALYFGARILSGFAQFKFGYWTIEWNPNAKDPEIMKKVITLFCQMPEVVLFVILIFMIMMKFHTVNPVTKFFGKISLDTYLMNLMALQIFRFLLYGKAGNSIVKPYHSNCIIFFICVFAATIVLGLIFKLICDGIMKIIAGKNAERYLKERAEKGNKAKFEAVLDKTPNIEPEQFDKK